MSKIHRYQNGFWEEVDKEHGSPAFDSTCPKQLESQFSEAELADVSNANSATQVPHTEDVPMDWSDSGGMQSPQTKVNYDVELPNSDADQDHPERSKKQPSCSTATGRVTVSPDDTIQLQCSTETDLLGDVSAHTVAQTSDSGGTTSSAAFSATPLSAIFSLPMTRWEFGSLEDRLPKVSSLRGEIEVLFGHFVVTDPLTLLQRPSESLLNDAMSLMAKERGKQKRSPTGVKMFGFGNFDLNGVGVLRKFCSVATTKRKLNSEQRWMSKTEGCTDREKEAIMKALWHTESHQAILKFQRKSVDSLNFAELVEERYLDNFVIDICIGKCLEEARSNGNNTTVYLPSEFFTWMTSDVKSFKSRKLMRLVQQTNPTEMSQILAPVHFPTRNHWGMIYVDLLSKSIFFDDGMKFQIPSNTLSLAKAGLHLLQELCPSNEALKTNFWTSTQNVTRFGMPSQVSLNSSVGIGSCGVGVILAAMDFISLGPSAVHNLSWKFSDMQQHRLQLMIQILSWSKAL